MTMSTHAPRALVAAIATAVVLATPAAAQQGTTPDSTIVVAVPATPAPKAPAPRLRGMARFGLEEGGEKVMQLEFDDGSESKVTAGGGLHLSVGAALRALQTRAGGLDAQVGLGLKWRTIPAADNQDVNWLRFPVDAMLAFRSTRGFGIAGGATVHLANKLKASGDVADGSLTFSNTPGFLVQAEYAWRGAIFDLRYTSMQYEVDGAAAEKVDASSIGLGIGMLFGRLGKAR